MNTSEQKTSGRTRGLLTLTLVVLFAVVIALIWGWREHRHLQEAVEEKRQIQSRQQQKALKEREELLRFLTGQLDTIQQQIDRGTQESREALELFSTQLLPAREQELVAQIDNIRKKIKVLEARRQQEAGAREIRNLQDRQQSDYAVEEARTRAMQELSENLQIFWEKGVELARLEALRELIVFREEQLDSLMDKHHGDSDVESLLQTLTVELYQAYSRLEEFQFSFDEFSAHRQNFYQYHDSYDEIPYSFMNASLWEFKRGIRNLQEETGTLKQEIARQLDELYEQGLDVGTSAEIQYFESLLNQKDLKLSQLRNELSQAEAKVTQQRQQRTRTLQTIDERIDSAGNCYNKLHPLLAETRGRINASLAEHAVQQGDYELAIAYFFEAITTSPEQERYYSGLAEAFIAVGKQETLPSAQFLKTSFKQLFEHSKTLFSKDSSHTPSNVMKKSFSAIYYEFTKCFVKQKDLQKASFALKKSLQIARSAENNDKNINILLEKQEILNQMSAVAMRK